jgi:hypothetical protein
VAGNVTKTENISGCQNHQTGLRLATYRYNNIGKEKGRGTGWESTVGEFINRFLTKDSSLLHFAIHSHFYWRILLPPMVFSDSSFLQQQLRGGFCVMFAWFISYWRLLPMFQFPLSAAFTLWGAEPPLRPWNSVLVQLVTTVVSWSRNRQTMWAGGGGGV